MSLPDRGHELNNSDLAEFRSTTSESGRLNINPTRVEWEHTSEKDPGVPPVEGTGDHGDDGGWWDDPVADDTVASSESSDDVACEDDRGYEREMVDGIFAVSAADVVPEDVQWLWESRIAYGSLTVLAGDPGLGKSMLTCKLAAELSRGDLADGSPGVTLIASGEDSWSSTLRPRLEAAGADLKAVKFLEIWRDGLQGGLILPNDAWRLAQLVTETRARLLVIDPLMSFLGSSVDSYKDQSIRGALTPLRQLAESSGCAVLVVAHLNKGQGSDPIMRLGGSVGLPASARSVLLLGRDPDNPDGTHDSRRVLAHAKSNLGPLAPSLAYAIRDVKTTTGTAIARLEDLGESSYDATALLSASSSVHESKVTVAEEFLLAALAGGPRPASEIQTLARSQGISDRTLRRAKKNIGVDSDKACFKGGWLMSLPPTQESGKETERGG